jgi:outer membrane protein
MKKPLVSLLLSGVCSGAFAQAGDADAAQGGGPPRGWQAGIAAVVSDSPYAGEGTRVIPIPLIGYEGERFYFRGITAGWRLVDKEWFELSAIAKLRLDGFDIDDLGQTELAANGLDHTKLEDRDDGLDLGLAAEWNFAAGQIELEVLADVTDASGGQEVSLQYGYPLQVGKGMLTPGVGVKWQSKDLANYYYGTLDEEVARGVVDYKPGSVTIPHVGLNYLRPIGQRWAMIAMLDYSLLPDELSDSPLLEPDTDGTLSTFIGFTRGF